MKYVQQPLVSAYSTKNTLVSPTHNEIFLRDFSGATKENKVWELEIKKVVEQNEGKCYVEVDDYHLILDIDYSQVVRLVKHFAKNLPKFTVSDRSCLLRSAFYKSIHFQAPPLIGPFAWRIICFIGLSFMTTLTLR